MNDVIVTQQAPSTTLEAMTLEELMDAAMSFGNIYLFQSDTDRCFNFQIAFRTTVQGAELCARSGYKHDSIKSAVIEAIIRAEQIKQQFKE